MSTSPSFPPGPQQQQPHHFKRVEEQQGLQNRHIKRLEQYRQHPVLLSQSPSFAHHPHTYHPYHPYHSYQNVHNPQLQSSSSLLPPLLIERQASPTDPSSRQDSAFYSLTPWQQLSPVQYQNQYQQSLSKQSDSSQISSSLSPTQLNLQKLLFDEDPVPFEGFSIPPEFTWDPLAESGSNLLETSAGPVLYPASLDTSSHFFSTPNLSTDQKDKTVAVAATAITVAGSSSQSTTLLSRRVAAGHQQRSLKMRVNRRIDMYREPKKQDADQSNNNDNNSYRIQTTLPLHPNEWYESLSPPAVSLSPLSMVDTNGFQSSLIQSLANLTTSSPNLACLSPPAISSAFGQTSLDSSASQRSVSISSDHISGLYTQSNEGINNKSNDGDSGENSKTAAEEDDDESDRRFQCPVCPKRFLRQYNLNAHLKTHSQVRAHACTQCDKSFLRPYDLTRHQRIHSNSKPYTCNICQQIFIRNDAIWRHYRRAHLGHPDVPPARRQRRPQRTSISPGNTTIATNIGDNYNNNNNTSSAISPIRSASTKSTSFPTFSPHDMTSLARSPTDTSSSYSSPSASVVFTSMELPSLDQA